MEEDTKVFMQAIRGDIQGSNAEIHKKLDAHGQALQKHEIEDIRAQAQLEAGQLAIRQELATRRTESDWRKQQSFVERTGKYALWAAVTGALAVWVLEHFLTKK